MEFIVTLTRIDTEVLTTELNQSLSKIYYYRECSA